MASMRIGGEAGLDRVELRRPDGEPVRVLVVDDEPTLTDLLSMALRYEGWQVRTAADGMAALRAPGSSDPTRWCST